MVTPSKTIRAQENPDRLLFVLFAQHQKSFGPRRFGAGWRAVVLVDNQKVASSFAFEDPTLQLTFSKPIVLEAGSVLKVNVKIR